MIAYDEDYYLRGRESGKSLYSNYRWLPLLTIPMCRRITEHCGITCTDTILDVGCARGYLVKALRMMGYNARGIDISPWAIQNCDPDVVDFVECTSAISRRSSWLLLKDVGEHLTSTALSTLVLRAADMTNGMFIVVPLAGADGKYVVPEYEMDVTHVIRWTLPQWTTFLIEHLGPGWSVSAQYRVNGIKDNYAQFEMGNGFITARKLV